uniref:Uncharacterized protein n=1 Tax=Lepeophtheirus salmonis TaxID=72036 RepID=A0A0K2UED7_LEPSM
MMQQAAGAYFILLRSVKQRCRRRTQTLVVNNGLSTRTRLFPLIFL